MPSVPVMTHCMDQKFVQLSILLIDLVVGTYRFSNHARLEAFVIQTNFN